MKRQCSACVAATSVALFVSAPGRAIITLAVAKVLGWDSVRNSMCELHRKDFDECEQFVKERMAKEPS